MKEKIELYILLTASFSAFVSSIMATYIIIYDPAINGRHEEFDSGYIFEIFGVYLAFFIMPMIWFGSIFFVFMMIYIIKTSIERLKKIYL